MIWGFVVGVGIVSVFSFILGSLVFRRFSRVAELFLVVITMSIPLMLCMGLDTNLVSCIGVICIFTLSMLVYTRLAPEQTTDGLSRWALSKIAGYDPTKAGVDAEPVISTALERFSDVDTNEVDTADTSRL